MVETRKTCRICGETRPERLRPAIVVRPGVADIIRADLASWDDSGWICLDDLQRYRHQYVSSLLQAERGELDDLEREVLTSLDRQEIISRNPEEEFQVGSRPRGLESRTASPRSAGAGASSDSLD